MKDYPVLLPLAPSTDLEIALEQSQARLSDIPEALEIVNLWTPGKIPAHMLPWLAWALSVDHWEPDLWTTQVKRDVTEFSIQLHRHKGTPWAMRWLLKLIGFPDVDIIEWWQDDPANLFTQRIPHTFCVRVRNQGGNGILLDRVAYDHIRRLVETVKPVRSHYCFNVGATLNQTGTRQIRVANVGSAAQVARRTADALRPAHQARLGLADVASVAQVSRSTLATARPLLASTGVALSGLSSAASVARRVFSAKLAVIQGGIALGGAGRAVNVVRLAGAI